MKDIVLRNIVVQNNRIEYDAVFPKEINDLRRSDDNLYVELPSEYDVSSLDKSVLTIPFVGTLFGLSILFGCEFKIECIDKRYYDSFVQFQSILNEMYPKANLHATMCAKQIVENSFKVENKSSVFFTGGLDATSALVEVADKSPMLLNVWGGDVRIGDDEAHKNLDIYFNDLQKHINGLSYNFIKSNCRELFVESRIDKYYRSKIGRGVYHGYWSSIAHIITMTAVVSPILVLEKIGNHFIGSSYEEGQKVFCANNEAMVNAISIAGCKFTLLDTSLSRTKKAEKIVQFCQKENENIFKLKVCWYSKGGHNCSACEKCYRTIMDITYNGGNPNDFGFDVDSETYQRIKLFLDDHVVNEGFWKTICDNYKSTSSKWSNNKDLSWILNARINTPKAYIKTIIRKIKG